MRFSLKLVRPLLCIRFAHAAIASRPRAADSEGPRGITWPTSRAKARSREVRYRRAGARTHAASVVCPRGPRGSRSRPRTSPLAVSASPAAESPSRPCEVCAPQARDQRSGETDLGLGNMKRVVSSAMQRSHISTSTTPPPRPSRRLRNHGLRSGTPTLGIHVGKSSGGFGVPPAVKCSPACVSLPRDQPVFERSRPRAGRRHAWSMHCASQGGSSDDGDPSCDSYRTVYRTWISA